MSFPFPFPPSSRSSVPFNPSDHRNRFKSRKYGFRISLLSSLSQEGCRVATSRARRSASEGELAGDEDVVEREREKAAESKGVVEIDAEAVGRATGAVDVEGEVEGGAESDEDGEERRARLAGGEVVRVVEVVLRKASASPSCRFAMLVRREGGRRESREGEICLQGGKAAQTSLGVPIATSATRARRDGAGKVNSLARAAVFYPFPG